MRNASEYYRRQLGSSPSCHTVTIDGEEQIVAILNESNMKYKRIVAMPGYTIKHGGLVDWNGGKWLVFEKDFNNELYERARIQQCNYVLKWINSEGNIVEKWCIAEDGTKYLIGEREEDVITIGDSRIAITITRDNDTQQIERGRRFLVDDPDGKGILAYEITKLNRLYNVFQDDGVYRYILGECDLTNRDSVAYMIADYYPPESSNIPEPGEPGGEVFI